MNIDTLNTKNTINNCVIFVGSSLVILNKYKNTIPPFQFNLTFPFTYNNHNKKLIKKIIDEFNKKKKI